MSSRHESNKQLAFSFPDAQGLPFAVSQRAIERAASRELRKNNGGDVRYFESVERLRVLRKKYRAHVRHSNLAGYASTAAGRRLHRVIDAMVIELCGRN